LSAWQPRKILSRILAPFTGAYFYVWPGMRFLMYHRVADLNEYDQLAVTPEHFKAHMVHLTKYYNVISLTDAVAKLAVANASVKDVVVTFDDGYLDNLTNAMPVLREFHIPATIFITTKFCDQNMHHPRYKQSKERLHLTWEEVRALSTESLITIGSHTITHPFLSRISDSNVQREIIGSKRIIEDKIGTEIQYFCYPSGDFTLREQKHVRQAGYKAAVSVAPGVNRDLNHPFYLRRTEMNDKDDEHDLRVKLNGGFDVLHHYLYWKRKSLFSKERSR
jgi:peptidoglycan/xylan/chitin deacetylase (PgdA/CDA1 family)